MPRNNETLGMTVEKVICDLFGLDAREIAHRSDAAWERQVRTAVSAACQEVPKITSHVGQAKGARGGQSKSPVDFTCIDLSTISLKTSVTPSAKVCPPESGQPGNETFDHYFGHLYEGGITYDKFKKLCLTKFDAMIPIYLKHLFDCDYLIWVYLDGAGAGYRVIRRATVRERTWEMRDFTFTKTLGSWNESCTVKYRGVSLAEFQVHAHRNSYKFRFNLRNLCGIVVR